jgi:hypothetical protein
MIETQTTINAWADATFGPCDNMQRLVARANQEMAELLSEITMPIVNIERISEECADVAHILFRVAGWAGEDLMPIFQIDNLIVPNEVYGPATRANEIMSFILGRLSSGNAVRREDIGRNVAMIMIKLCEVCAVCKIPLGDAIDRKMVVLRSRKWNLAGDGTAYHVPQSITPWHDHTCAPMLPANLPRTTLERFGKNGPEIVGELYDCGHIHRTYDEAQQCATNPRDGINARSRT